MKSQRGICLSVFIMLFLNCAPALSQGDERAGPAAVRRLIISPVVGPEIDRGERETYRLFPGVDHFHSLRFLLMADSSIRMVFRFEGGKRDSEAAISLAALSTMAERINNWEALKEGEYRMGSSTPVFGYDDHLFPEEEASPVPAHLPASGIDAEYESSIITLKQGSEIQAERVYMGKERLYFIAGGSPLQSYPLEEVRMVRARTGSSWMQGALIGSGVGFAVGLGVYIPVALVGATHKAAVSSGLMKGSTKNDTPDFGSFALPGVLIGGLIGGILGAEMPRMEVVYFNRTAALLLFPIPDSMAARDGGGTTLFALVLRF